jgi:PX domain
MFSVEFIAHLIQPEYTEYHIKVTSIADNASWLIRRRYSEFRELHDHLQLKFYNLPPMPAKKLWGNQDPTFVKDREQKLQAYMNGVLQLDPECRTRFLRRFLEIKDQPQQGTGTVTSSSIGGFQNRRSSTSGMMTPGVGTFEAANVGFNAAKEDEKKLIVKDFEEKLFNLSTNYTLIDPTEEEERSARYRAILSELQIDRIFDVSSIIRGTKSEEISRQAIFSCDPSTILVSI